MLLLVLAGLLVRLVGAFLYGSQDMEYWKAWGSYVVQQSLTGAYGAGDSEIIGLWKDGKGFDEVREITQRSFPFQSHKHLTEYKVQQPPLFIYSLYVSTWLYRNVSPTLVNGRLFNFFINLQPIVSSACLALVIAWFVSVLESPSMGRLAGIVYWLNPLVIINAPVQAFQDPLCALFAVAAITMLYRRRLMWAFVCLTLSVATKPQGALIAPVVIWVGLCEHRRICNLLAWAMAVSTGVFVSLPFLLTGHLLSMIQGVLSVTENSVYLSTQSMNVWWPVQYAANFIRLFLQDKGEVLRAKSFPVVDIAVGSLFSHDGMRVFQILSGRNLDVTAPFLTADFGRITHINPAWIGFALLTGVTVLNLWHVRRGIIVGRRAIIVAAGMQVYAYFILRTGVQSNHYFILIPLFTLIAFHDTSSFKQYVLMTSIFLMQDILFYGLGRDVGGGLRLLQHLYLGWTVNILAVANVALFIALWRHYVCILRGQPVGRSTTLTVARQ